jgi:hypothetical protein
MGAMMKPVRAGHGAQVNYRAAPRPYFWVVGQAGSAELVKLAQAVRPATRKRTLTESLGAELRAFYAGVLTEPLPDAWATSLDKIVGRYRYPPA